MLSEDFDVFCPDMKGFGKNADMPYPYALNDYLSEIREYIKEKGLNRPHVIGHSFGGRVAIKLAAAYKNLTGKLVLCDAAGMKPRFSFKKAGRKAAFKVLKNFLPKERLKNFYSSDYLAVNGVLRESFKLIVSENLEEYLNKIENKTLVIFGRQDKETPPYMAKRLYKGIKNSELQIIDGAGHFCFIDKPFTFYEEVKRFLLN